VSGRTGCAVELVEPFLQIGYGVRSSLALGDSSYRWSLLTATSW
jgi:hypothetical protein